MKSSFLSALVLGALAQVAFAANADVVVGEPYPDLRLPTVAGETLSISSLRGKKLLLIEFASW